MLGQLRWSRGQIRHQAANGSGTLEIGGKENEILEQIVQNDLYNLLDKAPLKYEGFVTSESELCVVVVGLDEYTLELQVDTVPNLVKQAMFNGAVPQGLAPLLNRLCQTIENCPIQDISGHAVARLEYQARNSEARLVPGVVLSLAVDSRFAGLQ